MQVYNVDTDTWEETLHFGSGEARYLLAATTVGNLVLFAGGNPFNYGSHSDNVDIYDTVQNKWTLEKLR